MNRLNKKIVQWRIRKINRKISKTEENCNICADFFLNAFQVSPGLYSDRDRAMSFKYIKEFATKLNKLYDKREGLGEQYLTH